MKREWVATALLLALFLASLVNIACLDRLIGDLETELETAERQAGAGRYAEAEAALDRAIARWVDADRYTHIFIRHPEIDACSDAFFELKGCLSEQNAEGFPSAFEKLKYHLESIDEMEHIRLGSVF